MANPNPNNEQDRLLEEYENFVKFFDKEKIPLRTCICFDRRIQYFSSEQLFSAIKKYKDEIPKLLKTTGFNTDLKTDQDVKDFIANILKNMVILKLVYKGDDRSENPRELGISRNQDDYEDKVFFGWVIVADTRPGFMKMTMIMMVIIIFFVYLWWSQIMRIYVYYTFVAVTIFCILILVLKFGLNLICSVANLDLVLIPNLLEDMPLTQVFRPFIAISKISSSEARDRKVSTFIIIGTIIFLALVKPDALRMFFSYIYDMLSNLILSGEQAISIERANVNNLFGRNEKVGEL